MKSKFQRCKEEFYKLEHVYNDPLSQKTIADYWFAARIELDLIEEGEEIADLYTMKQLEKLKSFIKKWESEVK